jgi:hypothetical protein
MPNCYTSRALLYPKKCENNISNEYAQFLNSQEWDYYLTLTTRYQMSIKSARRAAERLFSRIEERHGGSKLFWAAEPFDSKESYHLHGLIHFNNRNIGESNAAFHIIKDAWQIVSKGGVGIESNYTLCKRYVKDLGAHYYVGKYIQKRHSDYDILFSI